MKATNIFYTVSMLILIGINIYSIIKNRKMNKYDKSKNGYIVSMSKGWIYFFGVFTLIYVLLWILDDRNKILKITFWIMFFLTQIFNVPTKFIICEDGIYFNNLCNYSVLFVPYEKVDSWHFNKFEKRKLLIETKEKSTFYRLQEFKIKEEEVDIVTDLLLKYCGEKKDR